MAKRRAMEGGERGGGKDIRYKRKWEGDEWYRGGRSRSDGYRRLYGVRYQFQS